MNLRRGDIFWANLGNKCRPWLVVQNDIINRSSNYIIVASLTTNLKKTYPTHPVICWGSINSSCVKCEEIKQIEEDPSWCASEHLPPQIMEHVNNALKFALGVI